MGYRKFYVLYLFTKGNIYSIYKVVDEDHLDVDAFSVIFLKTGNPIERNITRWTNHLGHSPHTHDNRVDTCGIARETWRSGSEYPKVAAQWVENGSGIVTWPLYGGDSHAAWDLGASSRSCIYMYVYMYLHINIRTHIHIHIRRRIVLLHTHAHSRRGCHVSWVAGRLST